MNSFGKLLGFAVLGVGVVYSFTVFQEREATLKRQLTLPDQLAWRSVTTHQNHAPVIEVCLIDHRSWRVEAKGRTARILVGVSNGRKVASNISVNAGNLDPGARLRSLYSSLQVTPSTRVILENGTECRRFSITEGSITSEILVNPKSKFLEFVDVQDANGGRSRVSYDLLSIDVSNVGGAAFDVTKTQPLFERYLASHRLPPRAWVYNLSTENRN